MNGAENIRCLPTETENGNAQSGKPLKRLSGRLALSTGLKRGVNGDPPVLATRCGIQKTLRGTAGRFIRFGLVGGSGVLVDMAMFFVFADARTLHLNISLAKVLAAETAIVSNFTWNDLWTFRDLAARQAGWMARAGRFLRFNVICLAGIALNVLLLNVQIHLLGINMYAANLVAIFVVSAWNFVMNLKLGWKG